MLLVLVLVHLLLLFLVDRILLTLINVAPTLGDCVLHFSQPVPDFIQIFSDLILVLLHLLVAALLVKQIYRLLDE